MKNYQCPHCDTRYRSLYRSQACPACLKRQRAIDDMIADYLHGKLRQERK